MMKKLKELGISPAPWDGVTFCHPGMNGYVVSNANLPEGDTRRKIVASDVVTKNARLIAAAPELYECLRKYVEGTECSRRGADRDCERCPNTLCIAKSATAALRKAGGEDEPAAEQNCPALGFN